MNKPKAEQGRGYCPIANFKGKCRLTVKWYFWIKRAWMFSVWNGLQSADKV